MKKALTVVDLFCGSGGISLGFQMAGFKIIYGLDNNKNAIETYSRNFPNALVECRKIEDVEINSIPRCDIIVGGPPCVNFSTAKGSRANVLEGLKLVQAFLRIIYLRKPKYWIMENVPRIGLHLPDRIPLKWIGIDEDGELDVPIRKEFDVSLYGAPQRRKRLLIGDFPIPKPLLLPLGDHSLFSSLGISLKTLGHVVNSLPDPDSAPMDSRISDPNYNCSVIDKDLTDHFMNTTLTDHESKQIMMAKTNHPYMGRMDFPDDLDKPARTVVSLQMGRETLIISANKNKYRRATVRECATLQTFPLTFQFAGKTRSSRYKQAGNAVPPILAYHIASLIALQAESRQVEIPLIHHPDPFPIAIERKKANPRRINYSSSRIVRIPYKEVRGSRVELVSSGFPKTIWRSYLHIGEGKLAHMKLSYSMYECLIMAKTSFQDFALPNLCKNLDSMLMQVDDIVFMDSTAIHKYIHDKKEYPKCIFECNRLLDMHFPSSKCAGVNIPIKQPISGLAKKHLRLRILAAIPLLKKIERTINSI